MTKQQWTVTGLIVFLIFLEVVRNAGVAGFINTTWTNFQNALQQASIPALPSLPSIGIPTLPGSNVVKPPAPKPPTMPSSFPVGAQAHHQ